MYPFIHIGSFAIATYGLTVWCAAMVATIVLSRNLKRWKIKADAITIIAFATIMGFVGGKLYHVLEKPVLLIHHPALLINRAGFAWYGGLIAGILALLWQARTYHLRPLRLLDLCVPSAAIGYGIGRVACFMAGDGCYGIPTKSWMGVSFPHGIVPTTQKVLPTPIFELIGGLIIFFILWRRSRPGASIRMGQITGEYLIWAGGARFLVEFVRINPKIFLGLSNAQWASVASMLGGVLLVLWSRKHPYLPAPGEQDDSDVAAQSLAAEELSSIV